jgi:hypothetical protein
VAGTRSRYAGSAFRVGKILSRSFPIWLRNFVPFTILALVIESPYIAFLFWKAGDPERSEKYALAELLISLVFPLIVTGALMYGVFQQLRGQPAGIGSSLAVGLRRLLPVLGTALIVAILVALGFVLLVVPGIILACMYWVAVPAAVIEGTGPLRSLKRSSALTKGHAGTIFVLMLVLSGISYAVGFGLGLTLGDSPQVVEWASAGVAIPLGTLSSVANAVGYHDLRLAKEGVGIEDLVRVFE